MTESLNTNLPVRVHLLSGNLEFTPEGGEIDVHNLQVLFNRTNPGTRYCVKEGRLVEVRGLWGRFCHFINRTAHQLAVKQVVSAALENYNRFLSELRDVEVDRVAVQALHQRIGHLSPAILGRSHFNSHNKLSEYTLSAHTVRLKVGDAYIDCYDEAVDSAFIEFDLGNETDTNDLATLLSRKEGELLRAELDGPLESVEQKLSYRFERGRQEQRIQGFVTRVLRQLDTTLQGMEITRAHKVALKKIFTDSPLMRMKREVYNRGESIPEGSSLEAVLGEIFGSKLHEKRDALKTALHVFSACEEKEAAKAAIESTFMDLVIGEYRFAYQLGFDLERVGDGGSGGARYARDRFGRKILVVKPGDEGPHGPNNPQWYARFKQWFVTPRSCLRGNSEPLAEVDSYLIDRRLGIYQVPPTEWRYIASRQFNGDIYKECSVQMFVNGCETLGEYVGVSPTMHNLPRPLLRWYCGQEGWRYPQTARRETLQAKIPQASAERVAAHNLGIEDIDCHFENILVMLRDAEEPSLIERVLEGQEVEFEAIDAFVDSFFSEANNQALLQAILFSDRVEVDGEEKLVTLVKHDGGSSNPHAHPNGFLSTRFKHLFEVLPNYEAPFSEGFQNFLAEKDLSFVHFLLEKSVRSLRNTLPPDDFRTYWNNPENRLRFKSWVLETDPDQERALRNGVRTDLTDAVDNMRGSAIYFGSHLERIRGNITTRIESWRLLQFAAQVNGSMRDALQTRTTDDFRRVLAGQDHTALFGEMGAAKERPVNDGDSFLQDDYVGTQVLADLGEGYAFG